VVATGMPQGLLDRSRPTADWCLQWDAHDYNVLVNMSDLQEVMTSEPPPLLRDILDIATGALMSDIAVLRGSNEAWTRDIDLLIPVREPHFWEENKHRLTGILHTLTRDNFRLTFCAHEPAEEELLRPSGDAAVEVDCVSALSGGLDSLAGAVMLLRAGRKPLFVTPSRGIHRYEPPRARSGRHSKSSGWVAQPLPGCCCNLGKAGALRSRSRANAKSHVARGRCCS